MKMYLLQIVKYWYTWKILKDLKLISRIIVNKECNVKKNYLDIYLAYLYHPYSLELWIFGTSCPIRQHGKVFLDDRAIQPICSHRLLYQEFVDDLANTQVCMQRE
jgi:hypothetical protein